jgi:DNA-binding beta-propeller fold protein YncE
MRRNLKIVAIAMGAALQCTSLFADPPTTSYPHVNLSIGYGADPNWPQRSEGEKWRYVTGVAVDAKDQVWIVNQLTPQVQVFDQSGKLVDSWGQGFFKAPHFLRIDHEGNVWIADYERHIVQKFTPRGERLLVLGTPDEPGNDESHMNGPTDMAISPSGEIFVSDGYRNDRIIHFDNTGRFLKAWGQRGVRAGELSQPHSIAMDSMGRLYVAERNNCRIQIFSQTGKSLGQWRNLLNPWGIWITPTDEIYVCGSSPKRWGTTGNLGNPPTDQLVMKLNPDGKIQELNTLPLLKEGTLVPGEVDWAHGIAVDSQGNLYIGDVADNSAEHRVQKFRRLAAEE